MAAIARSAPQPLIRHPVITTKSKYRYVRIKEQMSHAMGVRNGGGLFSNGDSQPLFGGILFSTVADDLESSVEDANGEPDVSAGGIDVGKRSAVPGNRKTPVTAAS